MKKHGEYAVFAIYLLIFWAASVAEPELRRMKRLPVDGYTPMKVLLIPGIALLIMNIVLTRSNKMIVRLIIPRTVFTLLAALTVWLLVGGSYFVSILVMCSCIPSGNTIFKEMQMFSNKTKVPT